MKILIACEESQTVCKAFRAKGHEAYSCDILPPSGGYPEWHIQGDVLRVIENTNWGYGEKKGINFETQDGTFHIIGEKWDMIIAFPPCTYLSNAGACWLFRGKKLNQERFEKGLQGREFFMKFYDANCDKICVENPVPSSIYKLPKYTQIIQPYEFGEPYSKRTCLWLKGLSNLTPTKLITENITQWVNGGSKKADGTHRSLAARAATFRDSLTKSKTFQGVADAMAEQWG